MKLIEKNITQTIEEIYLLETLNLNNKTILELGCGAASMTKKIAENGFARKIIACEVDEIQHKKNLELNIENVEFKLCPAENIKLEDNSVDIVLMFKSFHHIPKEFMNKALLEIKRVLKPNGLAYISEPLFNGKQNELVSLFHNEEKVRIDAFNHIKQAVDNNKFKLFKEIFFQTEIIYKDFKDFENRQMNMTFHNGEKITEKLKNEIEEKFNSFNGANTIFYKPFRVDILQNID